MKSAMASVVLAVVLVFSVAPMAAAGTTTTTTNTQTPVPPYTLTAVPSTVNATLGSTNKVTLKATWIQAGITTNATLSASNIPPGVSVTFTPTIGPMPLISIVTIQVSPTTVVGQYVIQFTSAVGYLQETTSILLNVGGSGLSGGGSPLIDLIYQAYNPATFRISYQYSNNVKISVRPFAQSNYLYKVGPTNATISMPGSDNYVITISIFYPQITSQNLTWSIVGGNPPGLPSGANSFPVATNDVVMTIHVSTIPEPTAPSPTDVANALLGLMQNTLQQYNNQYQSLVNQNDQNFETIYVFMAIVLGAVIALISYVLKIARPRTSSYELKTESEKRG